MLSACHSELRTIYLHELLLLNVSSSCGSPINPVSKPNPSIFTQEDDNINNGLIQNANKYEQIKIQRYAVVLNQPNRILINVVENIEQIFLAT
jgi:hypothetical protein